MLLAETEHETRELRVIALWELLPLPSILALLLSTIGDELCSSPPVIVTLLRDDLETHDSGERFSNRHRRTEERSMMGQLDSVGSGRTVMLETLLLWALGRDFDDPDRGN